MRYHSSNKYIRYTNLSKQNFLEANRRQSVLVGMQMKIIFTKEISQWNSKKIPLECVSGSKPIKFFATVVLHYFQEIDLSFKLVRRKGKAGKQQKLE